MRNKKGFSVVELLLVIILAALIGTAGWYSHSRQAKTEVPVVRNSSSVTFNKITTSSAPLLGQTVQPQLIKDQMTLDKVWKDLYKGNEPPATPEVDFKTKSVILVTYGAPSGGFSISIDKVSKSSSSVIVNYTVNKPGDNCAVTDSIELNYELAAIPASNKDATFQKSAKTHSC